MEYTRVASSAKRGSEEQVVAARLAADANRKLSVQHGVQARASSHSGKELERLTKGAVVGSGVFGHLSRTVGIASGAFLGGLGFIAVAKTAIGSASALETQMARTSKVFGGQAAAIKAWSKDSAESLTLARSDALDAANTFGTLLVNMGNAPAKAAVMSKSLVQLAADMAAFKGVKPEVALTALESAIAGRTRGLKQLGVAIDATAVKTEAERLGLVKNTVDLGKVRDATEQVRIAQYNVGVQTQKHGAQSAEAAKAVIALHKAEAALAKAQAGHAEALTNQQKSLATYNLILAQTGKQQGYLAGHGNTLAVQTAKLHAQIKDLEEELGTALLPVLEKYLPLLTAWIARNEKSGAFQRDFNKAVRFGTEAVTGIVAVVKVAKAVFDGFASAVGGDKHAVELLSAAILAFKAAKLLDGLAAITAGAGGAAGNVGLLQARLAALRAFGPLAIAVTISIFRKQIADALDQSNFLGSRSVDKFVANDLGGRGLFNTLFGKDFVNKEIGAPAGSGPSGTLAGGASPFGPLSPGGGKKAKNQSAAIAATAQSQLGIPYQWGGPAILGAHTDCAGLAQAVLAKNGIHVGRTTYEQWAEGHAVVVPQPGDLVFFHMGRKGPEHVGVYIGYDEFIEDPHTGSSVRVARLSTYPGYVGSRSYVTVAGSTKTYGAGTKPTGTTGGTTGTGGFTEKPPPPKPTKIKLPANIRAELGRAEGTKGLADDIKANQDAVAALKAMLDKTTNKNVRADLEAAIGRYQKAINQARAKLATAQDKLATQRRKAAGRLTLETGIRQSLATATSGPLQTAFQLNLLPADEESKLKKQTATLRRILAQAEKDGKITPGEIAKIKASWKAMSTGIADAVQAVSDNAKQTFDRGWSTVTSQITRGISEKWALTQRDFQRASDTALQQMSRAFDDQLREFDRATQRGLDALASPDKTPSELLIGQLQKAHDDAAAQAQLAADQAAGDQKAVAEDLFGMQISQLQAQADAERKAADGKAAADQQSYQDQRDALRQSLQDQEGLREQSYQDQRDAQWQGLQDIHDDQAIQLQQNLDDWNTWIGNKQKSYADFLSWYAAQNLGAAPTAFTGADVPGLAGGLSSGAQVGGKQVNPYLVGRGFGAAKGFAAGGWSTSTPAKVDRRDTILARLRPGEYVMSPEEVAAGRPRWAGGAGDFHAHVHMRGAILVGAPTKEAAAAWAPKIAAEIERMGPSIRIAR